MIFKYFFDSLGDQTKMPSGAITLFFNRIFKFKFHVLNITPSLYQRFVYR